MKLVAAPGLEVRPSPINGKGCFATLAWPKGRKIAEYVGERISRAETRRRVAGKRVIKCVGIDSYWSIDATRLGNPTAFLNHCCRPNTRMVIRYGRVEVYALRDIAAGEELTLDYEYSQHPDSKRCICGAPNCRGTINKIEPNDGGKATARGPARQDRADR